MEEQRDSRVRNGHSPASPPRLVYLDSSATTPVAPEVIEAMLPFFSEIFGNASGAYALGRKARGALEDARSRVAAVLGCQAREIIFTSGGSESDNLALRGVAHAMRAAGRGHHLITTAIEHEAILATCHHLEDCEGYALSVLGVDRQGRLDLDVLERALRADTILVSVMMANNEVGSLQPIPEIAALCHQHGVLLHSDGVQVAAWCELDVEALGLDLLSLSAHKFYGPKGVGLLYVRDGTPLECMQTGGGHEQGRRSGTENVAGAVGLALALEMAQREREAACARAGALRDRLVAELTTIPGLHLTGHPELRMAGHASFCIEGVPADALLLGLDMRGICASSGSACSAGKLKPSHVLTAMGLPPELATGALRLSLGRHSSAEDIDLVLEVLPPLIERLRRIEHVSAG